MRGFCLVLGLVFSCAVFSKDIDLVEITSDTDMLPSYMYVVLDKGGDIAQFGKKDLDAKGNVMSRQEFSISLGSDGVVLKQINGRDIVVMRGHNVGPVYGGGLELDYLYNGITGSRKSFDMELAREDNKWEVLVEGKKVSHLHFKVHRKRFIGVIGVRKVQIVR